MTRLYVFLPPPGHLAALGVDREALIRRLDDADLAAEVVSLDDWAAAGQLVAASADPESGARVAAVGRKEPLSALPAEVYQVPVDLARELTWTAGDRTATAAALIEAAATQAGLARDLPRRKYEPSRRVLVSGKGRAAEMAVEALSAYGLNPEASEAGLAGLEGFVGAYRVTTADGRELEAGGLVICGAPADAGNGGNMTPADLAARIENGDAPWSDAARFRVVFPVGLDRAAGPGAMRRALEAAAAVRESGAEAYVIAPQIKVGASGLERLYSRARQAGVVFLRALPGGVQSRTADDGRTVFSVYDPLLKSEVALTADLTVADPAVAADEELALTAARLGLAAGADGYPAPDNVLFLPESTNRAGVLVVGPARGVDDPETLQRQIESAAEELDRLLSPAEVQEGRVAVDRGRCAICLTCYRVCPHKAVAFTNRPWMETPACAECGICAAACPMDALQLEDYSDAQVKARLKAMLSRPRPEDGPPRLVMFGCRRSAAAARRAAPPPENPVDVVFVPLPCAGRLEDDLILNSFVRGADGVLVAACHQGACRTGQGTDEARRRTRRAARLLAETGVDASRLRFVTLAPNMGREFTDAVEDFGRSLAAGEKEA